MKPEEFVVVGVAAAAAMTLTVLGYVARVMFGAGGGSISTGAGRKGGESVTPARRHEMIAEHAYRRAAERGFVDGDPFQDWLEAEREVEAELEEGGHSTGTTMAA
jgi:hypothetical protein